MKQRYHQKITTTGLQVDPYVIEESQWTREPEEIPLLQWSDVVLYMVSTPSPYTRETIKVILALIIYMIMTLCMHNGMEGNA